LQMFKITQSLNLLYSSKPGHKPLNLNQAGFTLIELITVILVASVIGYVSLAKFGTVAQSFKRFDIRQQLVQDLKRAQAEAVTWGCRGIFTADSDGGGYSFGCDFLAYDTNNPPAPDDVFFSRDLSGDITVSISTNTPIIFNSRGQSIDFFGDMWGLTVSLNDSSFGGAYATGTMLGTGVFSYDE